MWHYGHKSLRIGQIKFVLEIIGVKSSESTANARTLKEAVNIFEEFHRGAGFRVFKLCKPNKKWYVIFEDETQKIPKTLVFSSYDKYCKAVRRFYIEE